MRLVITLEQRFISTPNAAIWSSSDCHYNSWQAHLETFDEVCIIARADKANTAAANWNRVDGKGITFVALPYYLGPRQYLFKVPEIRRVLRDTIGDNDAVVFRIPSQIGTLAYPPLKRRNHPIGVEVVGDPYDVFARGGVEHPLRPFLRWWFVYQQKKLCSEASALHYVTEQTLQQRYPPSPGSFTIHYSNVELPDQAFVQAPRTSVSSTLNLITVGSLAQLYKGTDILIDAVKICRENGYIICLNIVGDGKYRHYLEDYARSVGVADQVQFLGQLAAGDKVREQLDKADLFVLPSKTEGLPRAMIEAMARALPCIGTTVGGIPELLQPEDMVPPGDALALAHKFQEVITNPNRMRQMSARNWEKAKQYHSKILYERRVKFCRAIRDITQEWLNTL